MPSGTVATTNSGPPSTRSSAPATSGSGQRVYNLTNARPSFSGNTGAPAGGQPSRWGSRVSGVSRVLGNGAVRARVPSGVPSFLGNQQLVIFAWAGAMAFVGVDEWKNNHILARPSRLWWTSVVYGMLAMAGMITPLIPLVNALAIGYLFVLAWQYFNGQGQFK